MYILSEADPSDAKVESFSDGELKEKKCTICGQILSTESQLQKHLREHEVNDKASAGIALPHLSYNRKVNNGIFNLKTKVITEYTVPFTY